MTSTTAALAVILCVVLVAARMRPSMARAPRGRTPRWHRPVAPSRWWRRNRGAPSDVDVAVWCQRVARSSRSGSSLTQAIGEADRETPPACRPFPEIGHAVARGRALLDALGDDSGDPSTAIGVVAPVLRACADLGGPPAVPLERVADVLLARATERDERIAGTAQARLSARVLTALPFAVVLFLAVSEPAIRDALTTPAGTACLVGGIVLNALGRWWMAALIRGSS